jgi:hypothetical protein
MKTFLQHVRNICLTRKPTKVEHYNSECNLIGKHTVILSYCLTRLPVLRDTKMFSPVTLEVLLSGSIFLRAKLTALSIGSPIAYMSLLFLPLFLCPLPTSHLLLHYDLLLASDHVYFLLLTYLSVTSAQRLCVSCYGYLCGHSEKRSNFINLLTCRYLRSLSVTQTAYRRNTEL